ncbi:hypothetical protein O181_088317 [Austropuccinia psidii MF-1]|uniref:RAVE complex protein Rav1 C-terminal domain-containing protein n=1 Tax=Austropuccinia psidii MF-1 TaxID=1389203 RepID=A0A9Q3P4W3_9BASI|nr:hypothetical protein [Austropuccinia psidii MF-1]
MSALQDQKFTQPTLCHVHHSVSTLSRPLNLPQIMENFPLELLEAAVEAQIPLLSKDEQARLEQLAHQVFQETMLLLTSYSLKQTRVGSQLSWNTSQAIGLFLWLDSKEDTQLYLETVAQSEYVGGDNYLRNSASDSKEHDPTPCSVFYMNLGKKRLLLGPWKVAYGHPDRPHMLKFLKNDFSKPRWKTATQKNVNNLNQTKETSNGLVDNQLLQKFDDEDPIPKISFSNQEENGSFVVSDNQVQEEDDDDESRYPSDDVDDAELGILLDDSTDDDNSPQEVDSLIACSSSKPIEVDSKIASDPTFILKKDTSFMS